LSGSLPIQAADGDFSNRHPTGKDGPQTAKCSHLHGCQNDGEYEHKDGYPTEWRKCSLISHAGDSITGQNLVTKKEIQRNRNFPGNLLKPGILASVFTKLLEIYPKNPVSRAGVLGVNIPDK